MRKVKILIMGRTGTGKTTSEEYLSKYFNLKGLKSFTTRPKRDKDDNNHIFISEEEAKQYTDRVSETTINGYEYFATVDQLDESDIYVIDPLGAKKLLSNYPDYDYIMILMSANDELAKYKTRSRNNFDYESRKHSEDNQFLEIENSPFPEELFENSNSIKKFYNVQSLNFTDMYEDLNKIGSELKLI